MISLFEDCSSVSRLDVSNFDTSKVTSLSKMFFNVRRVKYLNVSNFNTNIVTDMSHLFQKCDALTSLDVSNFNTSLVTTMEHMFSGIPLKELNLKNFDTKNVVNMVGMFQGCRSMLSFDLSSFDTSSVTDLCTECLNLVSILSNMIFQILILNKLQIWLVCSKKIMKYNLWIYQILIQAL